MEYSELRRSIVFYRRGVRICLKERHKRTIGQVWIRLSNLYTATEALVSKIKKDNKKPYAKPDFKGFVNIEIPSELKPDCKAWIREDEVVALEIEEAIASLYKLSLTRNEKTDSVIASMTCNDPESPNAGLVLTAHAPNWYDALAVLMWKHRVLLRTDWDDPQLSPDMEIG